MDREKVGKTKHKVPKFRDIYDEDLDWQSRMETKRLGRKVKKNSQKRRDGFEKW
jgi:hypothetical protein